MREEDLDLDLLARRDHERVVVGVRLVGDETRRREGLDDRPRGRAGVVVLEGILAALEREGGSRRDGAEERGRERAERDGE